MKEDLVRTLLDQIEEQVRSDGEEEKLRSLLEDAFEQLARRRK